MRKKRGSASGIELVSSQNPHGFLTGEAGCSIMSHPSIGGFALDGIVRDGKVEAADVGSGIPAWMTGAGWHLKPVSNGAWALLNQGLMQAALVSDGDSVRLGAFDPNWTSSSLSWLIYRDEASGYFLINNGAGGWLAFDGNALGLIRHDGALRAEMCWQLGAPVFAADIREDKQESQHRSKRSRRLGKMSLFAR
ncbi:hypothetical protein [Sphingobium vermicomposti]|uniref:Uncharacterized protein n=1 Tax=Sphingobium vermicomposti TaxID=529005 RepID=A0A846M1F5_9SPHN|nr:hypothetical protein [Sphingobium vermicomposti]NIJ15453.1 hypothetical protein [Sphingobium vermicomposti]